VESERTVEDAARDLPAVSHLAESGGIDRRLDLRVQHLHGREDRDPRLLYPEDMRQVDRVLDDVALGVEVGRDVDRRVGDEERPRVGRHVDHEDVADAPRRAEPGFLGDDRLHQLVRMQAPLHERLVLARPDPGPPTLGRRTFSVGARTSAIPSMTTSSFWFTQRQSKVIRWCAESRALAVTETVIVSPRATGFLKRRVWLR